MIGDVCIDGGSNRSIMVDEIVIMVVIVILMHD